MRENGLRAFLLPVCLDERFSAIIHEYGMVGYGVMIRVLQEIYGGAGYYREWNEAEAGRFAKENGISVGVVSVTIACAVRKGLFDSKLYREQGVLTSEEIQRTYLAAGPGAKIEARYLLLSAPKKAEGGKNQTADQSGEPIYILYNNLKPTKKKRENESKKEYGELGNVRLTEDEYLKLERKLGRSTRDRYIQDLDYYISSQGKKYLSHYSTILAWERKQSRAAKPAVKEWREDEL